MFLILLIGWQFFDDKSSNPVLIEIFKIVDQKIMSSTKSGYPIFVDVSEAVSNQLAGKRIETIENILSSVIIQKSESDIGECSVTQIVFEADRKSFLRLPNPVNTSIDLRITECLGTELQFAAIASRISM